MFGICSNGQNIVSRLLFTPSLNLPPVEGHAQLTTHGKHPHPTLRGKPTRDAALMFCGAHKRT
eukprot:1127648-Pyramimonas_sp.AAC.1